MINRNLDGVYFRINRESKWQNICFTDLTDDEVREVTEGRSESWLTSLFDRLVEVLNEVSDIINREGVAKATESTLMLLEKEKVSVDKLIKIKNIIRNFADFYDIICED